MLYFLRLFSIERTLYKILLPSHVDCMAHVALTIFGSLLESYEVVRT